MPEISEKVALTYQGENILIPSVWWISTSFNELALQKYPVKTKKKVLPAFTPPDFAQNHKMTL